MDYGAWSAAIKVIHVCTYILALKAYYIHDSPKTLFINTDSDDDDADDFATLL